jgi:hypothetical protein
MRREFSENSNRLLKDSLTLETRDSTGKIAVPERGDHAAMARFNALFTMTGPGGGVTRHRMCRP